MKNNNSHKQPGLRLPLLPAPPGCGGPAPRGALPPPPPHRRGCAGRTGSGRKGFSRAEGEPSDPQSRPCCHGRGLPRALGEGGPEGPLAPSRAGVGKGRAAAGGGTVPPGWAPRCYPWSSWTDRPGDGRDRRPRSWERSRRCGVGSSRRPGPGRAGALRSRRRGPTDAGLPRGTAAPSSPGVSVPPPLTHTYFPPAAGPGRGAGGEGERGDPAAPTASPAPLLSPSTWRGK